MANIPESRLFGKLNKLAHQALESAAVYCKMRGHAFLEPAHWVHQIVQLGDSDVHRIINHFGIDHARLAKDLTEALDRLPRGDTKLSDHTERTLERAWVYSTLLFGESQIRTGHAIVGILNTEGLRSTLLGLSREFGKINIEALTDNFLQISKGSPEDNLSARDGTALSKTAAETAPPGSSPTEGKPQALSRFSTDLTERARKGDIDPVLGRAAEIRQIEQILMRGRQNNPILAGEAGVGKTAVVEGFALRIARGEVTPSLQKVAVRSLDLGLLQAGASLKGEFEQRLRQVIEEVQQSPEPIILFIDEAHMLVGAGGAPGQADAANLLKPALARGTLRTIAATTWAEYKQYFESDAALSRRFQVIRIEEPDERAAVLMLRGLTGVLEQRHRVQISLRAIDASVRLSTRYIPARQLPDKAVSLLDTACARVSISQAATPPPIEDSRVLMESLQTELTFLEREAALGTDHEKRRLEVVSKLDREKERLSQLESRWRQEKETLAKIVKLRAQLVPTAVENAKRDHQAEGSPQVAQPNLKQAELLPQLRQLETELAKLQGEEPLVLSGVDEQSVAAVVADWTGVPVGRMMRDALNTVLALPELLKKRIIGQKYALETIARQVVVSRAKTDRPNKPVGVFLLAGPSGVGKTETARALAEALYGGEQNLITVNMNQYKEDYSIASLIGARPGLVGYEKGGGLTEPVRRRPHSVVLLDEVEKAHPSVRDMFLQVFEEGWLEDADKRRVDFRNVIFLLTTNAGSDLLMDLCKHPETRPEPPALTETLHAHLVELFTAPFMGRVTLVPYYPIDAEMLRSIIRLQIDRLKPRLAENQNVTFTYDESALELIATRCTALKTGARMVDAIVTNSILPEISRELLTRFAEGKPVSKLHLGVDNNAFVYRFD